MKGAIQDMERMGSISEADESIRKAAMYVLNETDISGAESTLRDAGQNPGVDYEVFRSSEELNYPSFVSAEGISFLGEHAISDYLESLLLKA